MINKNYLIEERQHGIEHIVLSIQHNIDLLEFMVLNLNKERFNLLKNQELKHL